MIVTEIAEQDIPQIPNRLSQVEVATNLGSNHYAVQMDRREERYSSLIDRLEYTDFNAAANCAGKNAKFLLIELLN